LRRWGVGSSADRRPNLLTLNALAAYATNVVRALSVAFVLLVASVVQAQCVGDCDFDARVSIDELTTGVGLALLPSESPGGCNNLFDVNQNGVVEISELVTAMNNALTGCAACPRFDRPYAQPCHMPKASARWDIPLDNCTAAPMLDGWNIDSDGRNVTLELLGVTPRVVFYGIAARARVAALTGIMANPSGTIEPLYGDASFLGTSAQVLMLSHLGPAPPLIDACYALQLFGSF